MFQNITDRAGNTNSWASCLEVYHICQLHRELRVDTPLWCREQPAPWRRFGSSRLGYCVGTGECKDIFLELMLSLMLSQWDLEAIPVSTSLSTAPPTYGACCVQRCVPSAAPACQYAKVVRLRVASIPSYHLLLSRRAVLASQLWQLRIPHSHVGGLSCKG